MMNNPLFYEKDLGQDVRRKQSRERTVEEHEWISLDCRLYPALYEAGFEPHPTHDLDMKQHEIHRLLKIPKKLQHAFGLIQNTRELKVHSLLHRFYQIEYDGVFPFPHETLNQDSRHDSFELIDVASISKKLASKQDICALIGDESTWNDSESSECTLRRNDIIICSLDELHDIDASLPISDTFIVLTDTVRFAERPSTLIEARERQNHSFAIQNDGNAKKLASLTISIVFQGTFIGNEYAPGFLSASTDRLGSNEQREALGHARYDLQFVNTNKSLGRLVIEYEPSAAIDDMKLEVTILAYSTCKYSIVISGKIMYATEDFLVNELLKFLMNEQKICQLCDTVDDINLDIRIQSRKVHLLQSLCDHMERDRQEIENKIEKEEYQLENDDSIDYFEQTDLIKVSS